MPAAVIAVTAAACLASVHSTSANGRLSPARAIRTRPKKIIRPARIFGRKPEPGIDSPPIGRSPLSAITSNPKPMKAAPAAWSARSVMKRAFLRGAVGVKAGSSLHAADLLDRAFHAFGVVRPELRKVRLVHIGEIL